MSWTMEKVSSRAPKHVYMTSVADGETSDVLTIGSYQSITVTVKPGESATGGCEVTTDPPSAIVADTADWADWGEGDVTEDTTDVCIGQITGLRITSTSGAVDGVVVVI